MMQLIFLREKIRYIMKSSKRRMTVLSQIFKLFSRNLISKIASEFRIVRQSRSFSPADHVFTLFFGQLLRAIGLNDIYDALCNHSGCLNKIRECTPPSRNGLSHANRHRNAGMAEKLFLEYEIVGQYSVPRLILTYLLLCFIAWKSEWKYTFTGLFTALRGVTWCCSDVESVLQRCGTADNPVSIELFRNKHCYREPLPFN